MDIARVILAILLGVTAIFLILLVLIQRGRGGGLAGAFGGMGGQSAFGTKAGDLFTRVTIVTAAVWILLCALSVKIFSSAGEHLASDASPMSQSDSRPGIKVTVPSDKEQAAAKKAGSAKETAPAEKAGATDEMGPEKGAEKAAAVKPPATEGKGPAEDTAPADDK